MSIVSLWKYAKLMWFRIALELLVQIPSLIITGFSKNIKIQRQNISIQNKRKCHGKIGK